MTITTPLPPTPYEARITELEAENERLKKLLATSRRAIEAQY